MEFNMYNNLDAIYSELESILSSNMGGEQSDPHTQVSCMILKNHIWTSNSPIFLLSK